jgi:hypothetical protein
VQIREIRVFIYNASLRLNFHILTLLFLKSMKLLNLIHWLLISYIILPAILNAQVPVASVGICLDGNCENGIGTFRTSKNAVYQGSFKNGKFNGKGKLTFPENKGFYEGDWVDNFRQGNGIYVAPNRNRYEGSFVKGDFHGTGILQFASGDTYQGNWAKGKFEGKGIYTFKNGSKYDGNFQKGTFEGVGTMIYVNGDRYEGAWQKNLRQGKGKLFYKNGERYEGDFKNEKLEGFGTMFYANGNRYEGQWKDGKKDLLGKMCFAKGACKHEYWENGSPLKDCKSNTCNNVRGIMTYSSGDIYVGDFKANQDHGSGSCFYKNGDKYVGEWQFGAPNGKGVLYMANGSVRGAMWSNGLPIVQIDSLVKEIEVPEAIVTVDYNPAIKIRAVVAGVSRYAQYNGLEYADDDAYQYYAFLKSPEGGALPDKQVSLFVNKAATYANILTAMRQTFGQADENDVIIFYFSGHGELGAFLPHDYNGAQNRLTHQRVIEIMKNSKAKYKICLVDACHSGGANVFGGAVNTFANQSQRLYDAFEKSEGGLAILMSSLGTETSLETDGLSSGIFSHYVIRGLKGEADVNNNGIITIGELQKYVISKVREHTGGMQNPIMAGKFDANMPVSIKFQ